ncbi:MAG TPA: Hsp70 family protein [Pirellulales bacterium]
MPAQFAIGIDLGTTNSVLAYVPLGVENATVEILPIPQLVAPSVVEARPMLPSFLYLAADHEQGTGAFDLPWNVGHAVRAKEKKKAADASGTQSVPYSVVGELARRQAAEAPTRTVVAAKSWLCYSRVDRHQPLLPFGAPAEVPKVSPVAASRRYLEHLIAAWEAAHPEAPIREQQVVLTVPASFDASGRELTREAAIAAGLPENLVLLEEPQAAVYAWLADRGDAWRRELKVGDTLLICDIGGGTTDLTLIGVTEEDGELSLRRIAVGNHILVGGDNMDLALAHQTAGAFKEKKIDLDPWQSVSLWHACRTAKETLLAADGPKKHPVTILGRSSKLIGGTISVDLDRKAASALLLDGFFPACKLTDKPAQRRASGFRELGLPFESDAAITRHLAAFLAAHGNEKDGPVRPTYLLFNGGVFKADLLRDRLIEVIGGWFGAKAVPKPLEGNHDLDLAVARGAAYYGAAKQGRGVRIRGGAPRSYYVGIETARLAIPGAVRPLRALCVVPFGMEEGTETDVPSGEIGVVVGEQSAFRFFSSAVRKQDKPGDMLSSWTEDELSETDSLEATLPPAADLEDPYVPVKFHSHITELGVFELWCVSTISNHRWKLEFSVREDAD